MTTPRLHSPSLRSRPISRWSWARYCHRRPAHRGANMTGSRIYILRPGTGEWSLKAGGEEAMALIEGLSPIGPRTVLHAVLGGEGRIVGLRSTGGAAAMLGREGGGRRTVLARIENPPLKP